MASDLEAGLSILESIGPPHNPDDLKTLTHYANKTREELQGQIELIKRAEYELARARS
jgi:hypothetical protein